MTKRILAFVVAGVALAAGLEAKARLSAKSPALAHMVFFNLKDHSEGERARFVASCEKYLKGHAGTVYFSVGVRADDVDESVSVKDFDVALHVVFESKDGKAKYLESERHKQFVEENGSKFAGVRVFDSYLAQP